MTMPIEALADKVFSRLNVTGIAGMNLESHKISLDPENVPIDSRIMEITITSPFTRSPSSDDDTLNHTRDSLQSFQAALAATLNRHEIVHRFSEHIDPTTPPGMPLILYLDLNTPELETKLRALHDVELKPGLLQRNANDIRVNHVALASDEYLMRDLDNNHFPETLAQIQATLEQRVKANAAIAKRFGLHDQSSPELRFTEAAKALSASGIGFQQASRLLRDVMQPERGVAEER